MLVLADDAFERHGVERRNRERVRVERAAQSARAAAPKAVNYRIDKAKPLTPSRSHSFGSGGGGGGAFSPWAVVAMAVFLLGGLAMSRRQKNASA
jgi:hypothetical protein